MLINKKVNTLITSDDINSCYELEIKLYRNSCLNSIYISFEDESVHNKLNQPDAKYKCIDMFITI